VQEPSERAAHSGKYLLVCFAVFILKAFVTLLGLPNSDPISERQRFGHSRRYRHPRPMRPLQNVLVRTLSTVPEPNIPPPEQCPPNSCSKHLAKAPNSDSENGGVGEVSSGAGYNKGLLLIHIQHTLCIVKGQELPFWLKQLLQHG
jgi:hypothetical protein